MSHEAEHLQGTPHTEKNYMENKGGVEIREGESSMELVEATEGYGVNTHGDPEPSSGIVTTPHTDSDSRTIASTPTKSSEKADTCSTSATKDISIKQDTPNSPGADLEERMRLPGSSGLRVGWSNYGVEHLQDPGLTLGEPTAPNTESETQPIAPAKRGRKRKPDSVVDKPKPKRVRDGPKKPPACKRCYARHIGCERASEDETCKECKERQIECEKNDVKVIKGERKRVLSSKKLDSSAGISSQGKFKKEYKEYTIDDVEKHSDAGGQGSALIESDSKIETTRAQTNTLVDDELKLAETWKSLVAAFQALTATEREVIQILVDMKHKNTTSLSWQLVGTHFELIKSAIDTMVREEDVRETALKKLEELRSQLIWLNQYQE
ncbi:hypothetical protein ABW19_dt0207589 [Dactylella cylindrospora]|nr:hypothetical protein ABW19_dt0207589 [Dactylella cylindrospora]